MKIKKRPLVPLLPLLVVVFTAAGGGGRHRVAAQVFCRSQFNLANEACSLRTIPTGPNPARPLQLEQLRSNGSSSYELQADRHDRDRDRDRSGRGDRGRDHDRVRVRSRRHGLGHGGGGTDPYDTACCRRLMGIDNACICQAMSFLPVFMSRVKHAIKLTPVPGCDVSFECAAVY